MIEAALTIEPRPDLLRVFQYSFTYDWKGKHYGKAYLYRWDLKAWGLESPSLLTQEEETECFVYLLRHTVKVVRKL